MTSPKISWPVQKLDDQLEIRLPGPGQIKTAGQLVMTSWSYKLQDPCNVIKNSKVRLIIFQMIY